MSHSATLKVSRASKDDIYFDTVRISEIDRGGISDGIFCELRSGKLKAYVALRGMEGSQGQIKLDEKTRNKLAVEIGKQYEFRIRKLGFLEFYKPLWFTSNPYARVISQISLVGLALGIIGILPTIVQFVCYIKLLLCRYFNWQ